MLVKELSNELSSDVSNTQTSNISDQVVNSALRYRAQAPILDSLLKEIGISGNNINSFTNLLKEEATTED